jgi:hypothetical protein
VHTYWEKCPFHESGQCPQEVIVDWLLLLPRFLSAREIEAAAATCAKAAKNPWGRGGNTVARGGP